MTKDKVIQTLSVLCFCFALAFSIMTLAFYVKCQEWENKPEQIDTEIDVLQEKLIRAQIDYYNEEREYYRLENISYRDYLIERGYDINEVLK